MSTDTALNYVGPIMDAYKAAEKAGTQALHFALECGKQLNAAMKTVTAAKGKWKTWCEKHLKVSERTERLYRDLADAVAQNENFFANCKSIRDAIKHRAKFEYDDNGNLKAKPETSRKLRKGSETGSTAAGLGPSEADSPSSGLEAELENAAADEIITSIQRDPEKLFEVAEASIAKLTPDKVCGALTKAWDADQLRDLNTRLSAYLSTLATTPTKRSFTSSGLVQPSPVG